MGSSSTEEREQRILNYLAKNDGWTSGSDIMEACDVPRGTLFGVMHKLAVAGRVSQRKRSDGGGYKLIRSKTPAEAPPADAAPDPVPEQPAEPPVAPDPPADAQQEPPAAGDAPGQGGIVSGPPPFAGGIKARVLELFPKNGTVRLDGGRVAKELGISEDIAFAALEQLREDGLLAFKEVTAQYRRAWSPGRASETEHYAPPGAYSAHLSLRMSGDQEVDAIAECVRAVDPLPPEAKRRVIAYLADRELAVEYEATGA